MKIVFLLEEPSMKEVLNVLLPQILPHDVLFQLVPHQGKSDLRKSIPNKLRNWNEPDVKFVVLQDQDLSDCRDLKQDLKTLCDENRIGVQVCIACKELEAWYLGDLSAVERAYDINLNKARTKFKIPDAVDSPKERLYELLRDKGHSQISGARRIAAHMNVSGNISESFNFFVSKVRKMARD